VRRIAFQVLCALAVVGCLLSADAGAHMRQRALCAQYRCHRVAENARVRIVRVEARQPEYEVIPSLHYSVWKPSGRSTPFGDFAGIDASVLERFALAGRFVGYATSSCSHETLECAYGVFRMNGQDGRREEVPLPDLDLGVGEAPQPWAPCGWETRHVTALVVTSAGTVAWAKEHVVCELPHGSRTPVLLADSPNIGLYSLRLAGGHLYWREGATTRSLPMT
jgi:hypothetical protein